MKKKLLYIVMAFGFTVAIAATPAINAEANGCIGDDIYKPRPCQS
ncbi:hypothetical protein [Cytobacillus sp.]|nr:hypothetical protein [Cytobacillus sp.]